MNVPSDPANRLAEALAQPGPVTLTDSDRALVVSALAELAGCSSLIARQQLLLDSFGQDTRAFETALRASLDRLRRATGDPHPSQGFDFQSARAAREQLLRNAENSAGITQVLADVLRFVAEVAL